jgi:uncharacterized Rmd1/YagE family protein
LIAVALDGEVSIPEAIARLGWPELRRYPYGALLQVHGGARMWLFGFGAVVIQGEPTLDASVQAALEAAVGRRYLPTTVDTYFVEEMGDGADQRAPRVGWDRVAVPRRTPEMMAAIALLVGQSAALERYERTAEDLVEQALTLSQAIARTGELPAHKVDLMKRIGEIWSSRLGLTSWFYLVDRPEETWADATVARMYDALFDNLELAQRHEAMVHKLEAVDAVTASVVTFSHARRSYLVEVAVVGLIVLEVLISLTEMYLH